MKTNLKSMTNQQLWQLFPVVVEEYNAVWPRCFEEEEERIRALIGKNILRISHIGSTSVPGLCAKNIIDILIEIGEESHTQKLADAMEQAGYIYLPQPENPPPHMVFLKGYTENGYEGQPCHLHVRFAGDWDELYFRDYLREHSDAAREYAALKKSLQEIYRHDRDGYTAAKTDFIREAAAQGRRLYAGKYIW
ncbi:MAG: GrpB family protein [Christensenellaceae bacterium]|jgi:GrpB-like predicted nucleotidyltransferase (UPF0157 family)